MFWNILIGIASYALQLILAPKPQNAKAASLVDFDVPIAEEGIEIPELFGTDQLRVPNVVWYGDYLPDPIKGPRRYGFFGPRSTTGYRYKLGMHMVWCAGPVDNVSEIRVGDKIAWDLGITETGIIVITAPDLFGGDEREGGIGGFVSGLFGEPHQTQDVYLLEQLGPLLPSFRGVLSFVLQQFYVGNTAYIKPWEITAQRIFLRPGGSEQWYSGKAGIPRTSRGTGRTKRQVFDVKLNSSTSFTKTIDISGSTLSHLDSDANTLIIEDLKSGTIQATVALGYTPIWVHTSEAGQTMVLGSDANLYCYNSTTGVLEQTLTGFGDPTPYSETNATLVYAPTEFTAGDTTYLFWQQISYIVALANDGSGWSVLWTVASGLFNRPATMSVGPNFLYAVNSFRTNVYAWPWDAVGLGTKVDIDLAGMGIDGNPIAATYLSDSNVLAIRGTSGQVAITSEDGTTLVGFSETGSWASPSTDILSSARAAYGSAGFIFYATGASQGAVYIYTDTGVLQRKILINEWDLPANSSFTQSGFSNTEQALLVYNTSSAYVLFLPAGPYDMNPSHIIRECITHRMGYADADLNDDDDAPGFTYAADTLYDEGFGLTFKWSREEEVGEFINMVLAHIDAYFYISRSTGKFNLKLIRNDYDINAIPVIEEADVIEWSEVSHRSLEDAINSVTVRYTDRLNRGRDASHQVDNIAQMQQMDGDHVPTTRNYPGISTGNLAVRVARRDVKSLGIGIITGRIVCHRTIESWVNPGEPFRLVSARHKLEGEVMRVVDINFGDGRDNKIVIKFVQDVFHIGDDELVDTTPSDWENPGNPPQAVTPRLVWEMPYLQLRRFAGSAEADSALATNPDFAAIEAAGARPTQDATQAIISVSKNSGSYVDRDVMTFGPAGLLDGAIDEQVTTLTLVNESALSLIEDGTLAVIDGNDPALMEVVRVEGVSGLNLTISRGFLDTVPRAHADGVEVIVFEDFSQGDGEPYTETDTVSVKLRTTTPIGVLSLGATPADAVDLNSRAIRPLRPADCQIDGTGYGEVDATLLNPIPTSWANRNRLTETTPLAWDDASVPSEGGQTTTLRLLDPGGLIIDDSTYTGISGTTQDIDPADFAGATSGFIEFLSVRGGYDSWQSYRIAVLLSTDALLLEGDAQSGTDVLLLEGDAQSGTDVLLVEGSD